MFQLIYFPVCPHSRAVMAVLGELRLKAELGAENPHARRPEFLDINPAGDLPVLAVGMTESASRITANPAASCALNPGFICGAYPCLEFLFEYQQCQRQNSPDTARPPASLLPEDPLQRAEVRRLVSWFLHKFDDEVSTPLLDELVYKRISPATTPAPPPDVARIRMAQDNLTAHLNYMQSLLAHQNYLGGKAFSAADLVAAAHISTLDYLGQVHWKNFAELKDWYARLKSRPALRPVLRERLSGYPPPPDYENPDF